MQIITTIIYIIELVLIIISIINISRANKCLNIRNQNLQELIDAKEANQELRLENYEYQYIVNKISKIVLEEGQETIVKRFDKIKEVILSANKNNF